MIKNDILFTGYYGQLNTGDDAFVEVAAWGAQKFWNKNRLRFLAVKERLPEVMTHIEGYPIRFPKSYGIQQNILLHNAQYLISAGGSTFQNLIIENSLKAKAQLLAKNKKLSLGAIGVSIGPFKTKQEEQTNIEYLKSMSFLAVRDQRSYEYAKSLDLPYDPINAFDLAALLPDIYGVSKIVNKKKIIGISVCNYESYTKGNLANEIRRNKEIVELLKVLDKEINVIFKFFVINGNDIRGDLELTKETIKEVNFTNSTVIEYYCSNTQKVWQSIANCDFVISTRLHAGIFACFSNTPFMLVEYHEKCRDFLEDVGQDLSYRLNDAEFDMESIVNVIQQTILENRTILPSNNQEMIDKAYLNFKNVSL